MVAARSVEPKTVRANVVTRGVVQAERELTIIPEVTGRLVFVSKSLVAGGRVKKGQSLLRIDPRSYASQVTQTKGQLESARLQVEVEKNQKNLVDYESKLLGETSARSPVASRESFVRAAEANVQAQQGAVESAKLNLSRTQIAAPFDATVVSENVEQGQVVSAQSQLARLIATEELRVQVSVPVGDLGMFEFPSQDAAGAKAVVRQQLPRSKPIERVGEVTRLVRELDQSTRRARVLVTIKNPFDPALGLPLLPGAHVEVEITGRELPNVVVIERSAVYEGDNVWIVNEDDKLDTKKIEIVWSDRENVYVKPTFTPGERVVTTLMSTPVKGLSVRVQGDTKKASQRVTQPGEHAAGG
jgi:RND family efflux transporter MFP subunit